MRLNIALLNRFFKLQKQSHYNGLVLNFGLPADFSIEQIDEYGNYLQSSGKKDRFGNHMYTENYNNHMLIQRRNTMKDDMIILSQLSSCTCKKCICKK